MPRLINRMICFGWYSSGLPWCVSVEELRIIISETNTSWIGNFERTSSLCRSFWTIIYHFFIFSDHVGIQDSFYLFNMMKLSNIRVLQMCMKLKMAFVCISSQMISLTAWPDIKNSFRDETASLLDYSRYKVCHWLASILYNWRI